MILGLIFGPILLSSCSRHYSVSGNQYKEYAIDQSAGIDSSLVKYYLPYKKQMEAEMNRVIGRTDQELTKTSDPETLMGDFFSDAILTEGLKKLTAALRPWTLDFHVAQNDGTVFGSGSHDKTGRHCLATDPNGKLDIANDAGFWLRDEKGELTKAFKHICWDGCMFPNEVMTKQQTWNDILATMIKVREKHGWVE